MNRAGKLYRLIMNRLDRRIARLGTGRTCPICEGTFGRFTKYRGIPRKLSKIYVVADIIGSDPKQFGCPVCGAFDRERHLVLYFRRLKILEAMRGASILHFAPERQLTLIIAGCQPCQYVKADLHPRDVTITQVDITHIPFSDGMFDFIVCNHILEHIPDDHQAMRELFRVLKPGGTAILQTPYSKHLRYNFEADTIDTDKRRSFFYGQFDHVRIFSERQFFQDLQDIGFHLHITKHGDCFNEREAFLYGINSNEDLVLATK